MIRKSILAMLVAAVFICPIGCCPVEVVKKSPGEKYSSNEFDPRKVYFLKQPVMLMKAPPNERKCTLPIYQIVAERYPIYYPRPVSIQDARAGRDSENLIAILEPGTQLIYVETRIVRDFEGPVTFPIFKIDDARFAKYGLVEGASLESLERRDGLFLDVDVSMLGIKPS